uniref:Uncharacterized protein n=1 Tax=Catharus ustulatus TaxID=91951 RepID=A0A8C3VAV6_CATUS
QWILSLKGEFLEVSKARLEGTTWDGRGRKTESREAREIPAKGRQRGQEKYSGIKGNENKTAPGRVPAGAPGELERDWGQGLEGQSTELALLGSQIL